MTPEVDWMRVAVIGYGVEGRAAVDYWRQRGAAVVVHDRADATNVPAGLDIASGEDYLAGLDSVDLVVRSPSVRPDALPSEVPVTTVVSEFLSRSPAPVIGVTGTKGRAPRSHHPANRRPSGVRRRQHRHPSAGLSR